MVLNLALIVSQVSVSSWLLFGRKESSLLSDVSIGLQCGCVSLRLWLVGIRQQGQLVHCFLGLSEVTGDLLGPVEACRLLGAQKYRIGHPPLDSQHYS